MIESNIGGSDEGPSDEGRLIDILWRLWAFKTKQGMSKAEKEEELTRRGSYCVQKSMVTERAAVYL